jgi:hypothetical protein
MDPHSSPIRYKGKDRAGASPFTDISYFFSQIGKCAYVFIDKEGMGQLESNTGDEKNAVVHGDSERIVPFTASGKRTHAKAAGWLLSKAARTA